MENTSALRGEQKFKFKSFKRINITFFHQQRNEVFGHEAIKRSLVSLFPIHWTCSDCKKQQQRVRPGICLSFLCPFYPPLSFHFEEPSTTKICFSTSFNTQNGRKNIKLLCKISKKRCKCFRLWNFILVECEEFLFEKAITRNGFKKRKKTNSSHKNSLKRGKNECFLAYWRWKLNRFKMRIYRFEVFNRWTSICLFFISLSEGVIGEKKLWMHSRWRGFRWEIRLIRGLMERQ